jgi:hypothetical protein
MKMEHMSPQKWRSNNFVTYYHAKAEMVVSMRINGATNEVAQGRDM